MESTLVHPLPTHIHSHIEPSPYGGGLFTWMVSYRNSRASDPCIIAGVSDTHEGAQACSDAAVRGIFRKGVHK